MQDGTVRKLLVAAILSAIIAACDSAPTAQSASEGDARLDQSAPAYWLATRPYVVRAKMDARHGRIWALHADGVDLFHATGGAKVASIRLPGWTWAGEPYACPPDVAVGPGGDAFVTSNVTPALWRIEPTSLEVTRHELVIDERRGREVGFSSLTYASAENAFYAVGAFDGSLWRIDAHSLRAEAIGPAPRVECSTANLPIAHAQHVVRR